ncbi:MAG: site-specific integrase [Dysgonamonadaceae bacterium]|jgi:site-specific recombinase XerD|nr:site-specific integrase [Dysgonamonadaceae bacterium]
MATSIKLKFTPSKIKHKAGVICLQLIHNRKIKLLRTRFRLFPAEWDNQKETVFFGNSDMERQIYLQSIKIGLETELKQLAELIRILEMKSDYTVDELAELYTSNSFNGYFFPFVDYVVKNLKNSSRCKTATILQTSKTSFECFLSGQDILIDKIDNDLMHKYENYLKSKGVMKNTISCYMRALRSVYNQAVKRGLSTQKNPFANIFTRIDKTVKRAVSEDVIVRLKNMDLSSYKELELARDLFMFSFYMRGISFIDMANLRKSNMKNGYIIYFRSKTRQMLTVKLEICMKEIISWYESQTIDDYLLPVYTAQNRDNTSQLRNHNKRLKRISELLGLEKSLSSYVTRHSWATLALQKGISIEIISESMGHENETTTRIYLASLGQSAVDKANAKIIRLE